MDRKEYNNTAVFENSIEGWVCAQCGKYWGNVEITSRNKALYCCTGMALCHVGSCNEMAVWRSTECKHHSDESKKKKEFEMRARGDKRWEARGEKEYESGMLFSDSYGDYIEYDDMGDYLARNDSTFEDARFLLTKEMSHPCFSMENVLEGYCDEEFEIPCDEDFREIEGIVNNWIAKNVGFLFQPSKFKMKKPEDLGGQDV